jgi:hypothetical protein
MSDLAMLADNPYLRAIRRPLTPEQKRDGLLGQPWMRGPPGLEANDKTQEGMNSSMVGE